MSNKKILNLTVITAVVLLTALVAITLTQGASLKNTIYGITLLIAYVLLIAGYLSRIALVVLGVFAIYKVLQERAKASNTP